MFTLSAKVTCIKFRSVSWFLTNVISGVLQICNGSKSRTHLVMTLLLLVGRNGLLIILEKLTGGTRAFQLLRKDFAAGDITDDLNPKQIWSSCSIFLDVSSKTLEKCSTSWRPSTLAKTISCYFCILALFVFI